MRLLRDLAPHSQFLAKDGEMRTQISAQNTELSREVRRWGGKQEREKRRR